MQRIPQRLLLPQKQSFRSIRGLELSHFEILARLGITEIENRQNLPSDVRNTLNYKYFVQLQTWLVRYTDKSEICVTGIKMYRTLELFYCANAQYSCSLTVQTRYM